jgi:hypothetical protein
MDTIRPEVTGRRRSTSKTSFDDLGRTHAGGGQGLKPLGLSIKETAAITGESVWTVKKKLRDGTYSAKKSGRRTIVVYTSIEAAWNALPDATFQAPTPRKRRHEQDTARL